MSSETGSRTPPPAYTNHDERKEQTEVLLDEFAHRVEPDNHTHKGHSSHHGHHDLKESHHHNHHHHHHSHVNTTANNELDWLLQTSTKTCIRHFKVHTQPALDRHSMVSSGRRRPTSWVAPALMACVCCFFPTGICAVISAFRAIQHADEGDLPGAKAATLSARRLTLITVAIGMMLYLSGILFKVLHLDHN